MRVDFNDDERRFFHWVGDLRQDYAEQRGSTHRWGGKADPVKDRIRNKKAAGGEAAVAKHLNVWWPMTRYQPKAPDVAGFIEVRWREHHVGASLIVHPSDDESRIFMLVTGNESDMNGYFIRGWMYGWEAKRPEWWGTPYADMEPAWWVPWESLRDLATLPDVHLFRLSSEYDPEGEHHA